MLISPETSAPRISWCVPPTPENHSGTLITWCNPNRINNLLIVPNAPITAALPQ